MLATVPVIEVRALPQRDGVDIDAALAAAKSSK
jgi:hypothetical protein